MKFIYTLREVFCYMQLMLPFLFEEKVVRHYGKIKI